METIKQKLNLIHLYSKHQVDNVGFFSLSPRLGVREGYYGKLITRPSNHNHLYHQLVSDSDEEARTWGQRGACPGSGARERGCKGSDMSGALTGEVLGSAGFPQPWKDTGAGEARQESPRPWDPQTHAQGGRDVALTVSSRVKGIGGTGSCKAGPSPAHVVLASGFQEKHLERRVGDTSFPARGAWMRTAPQTPKMSQSRALNITLGAHGLQGRTASFELCTERRRSQGLPEGHGAF